MTSDEEKHLSIDKLLLQEINSIDERNTCEHLEIGIFRMIHSDKSEHAQRICIACGRRLGFKKKKDVDMRELPLAMTRRQLRVYRICCEEKDQ